MSDYSSELPLPKTPETETKTPETQSPTGPNPLPDENTPENQILEISEQSNSSANVEAEEEVAECGFCLFMKGGGCKESFVAWENCVEEGENNNENIVEKCFQVTRLLKECMEAHANYYEPVLRAEKAMEEEAARELDGEEVSVTKRDENRAEKGMEEEAVRVSDQEEASEAKSNEN